MDSNQGQLLFTPRCVKKCLFSANDNSHKKNRSPNHHKKDFILSSGDESDLEPMSPLALTDRSPSTCESSPGREFVSPLKTPDKSPILPVKPLIWDRLSISNALKHNTEEYMFRSLKKISRAARYSPRYNLFNSNSLRSLSSSPEEPTTEPSTPKRTPINTMVDIIPETPQRSFATQIENITETPKKGRSPEKYRLITPLGSITKSAPLPKLHRRKSLTHEMSIAFCTEQKENLLKRRAPDQLMTTPAKLFKADGSPAPRARASLFQENKSECGLKDFTLSTKTFYSTCKKSERPFVINSVKNYDVKRRRSLPVTQSKRRSLKRHSFGRINVSVSHAIKRPKSKVNPKTLKQEQQITQSPAVPDKSPSIEQNQSVVMKTNIVERAASPEIDENKRFFKTNKTIRTCQVATVTVNNKIKLKVADGKILLSKKNMLSAAKAQQQRTKSANVTYDATDLTVDEPDVETSLAQNKVANILKILEDDWANDDYDTMGTLTVNTVSPLKSTTLSQDTIMSPATELSNMTSTMNIKDVTSLSNFGNLSLQNTDNNNGPPETIKKKPEETYFPMFRKGYSVPTDIFEETTKSNKANKRNMQWQLSAKGGGADNQYQLDVGQKHFGATQCPECNVMYQMGDAEDENAHLNYHNSIKILKFQGWKTERVIMEDPFTSSRIILVEPRDSKQCWKKVSEILAVVDRDLGLADMTLSNYQDKKVFLYIREKSVLSVLVAEHIKTAYRMIPELIELDCCTAEGTPTKCGINVVWTAMSHRRQGIATKLVDILRAKFFYGYVMSLDDIAFSTPSPSGKIFAEKYTKTQNFKVYH